MVKPEKLAQVEEYTDLLKNARSVYLADYIGLDVASMEELRAQCRDQSVSFTVVKNRIMRRAAEDLGMGDLGQYLVGPTAVAISEKDEVAPAKLLVKFAKEKKEKPALKAAIVDGSVYGAEDAQAFAKLPSFDDMRATLLNVISAPATKIVRVVAGPGASVARVGGARKDQLG